MEKLFRAISTLTGTIIGVGFFSLPYITSKIGILPILFYFFLLGGFAILIHLIFGELALKTPDLKRIPGFAKFYLGKVGEKIAFFTEIFALWGTILAYLIIGGQFLTNLLLPIFGGNNYFYTLLYFLASAIFIRAGINLISKIEFSDLILFSLILILIFIQGFSKIKLENLFFKFDLRSQSSNLFLPYGPILFSLWGTALIPELEEMLGKEKKKLKKVIFSSILICALFYLLFIFLTTGISGKNTSPDAISGLEKFLGKRTSNFLFFFGTITTFTSSISLGLTLEKTFWYDFKMNKNLAWLVTCLFPLFLFFLGIQKFIPIISFIGGVVLGIEGILILLMYKKINPKNFLIFPLILILILGIFYEIFYFLNNL